MSTPPPTDVSQQLHDKLIHPVTAPLDAPSNLGVSAMQPSAPPSNVVHRSTVLNIEPLQNSIPSAPGSLVDALRSAPIPPEVLNQLSYMQGAGMPSNSGIGGGLFDLNSADLLPGMNYSDLNSMLAMAALPFPGQIDDTLAGPISEALRKEAAAAARAARQAKRREEKQRKQQRQRKTSNEHALPQGGRVGHPDAQVEAVANANLAAAMAAATSLPPQRGRLPAASVPSTSQQQQQQPASGREGGTANASGSKSELRAIKNRESAARSRAKKVEYTSALEAQVEQLRTQNRTLRTRVITLAAAPPDPHAGQIEGKPLRRTRTMPL